MELVKVEKGAVKAPAQKQGFELIGENSAGKDYAVFDAKIRLVGENDYKTIDFTTAKELSELKKKRSTAVVKITIGGEEIETELSEIKRIKFVRNGTKRVRSEWFEELKNENAKIVNVWLNENGERCEKENAKFEARVWQRPNGELVLEKEKIAELMELGETPRQIKAIWKYGKRIL